MVLKLQPFVLSLAMLLVTPACSDDNVGEPLADAAVSGDTGLIADAAGTPDTTTTPDGTATPDVPTTPDVPAQPDVPARPVNPTGEVLSLSLDPFEVAPGTERQVCKTLNVPGDKPMELVKIVSQMEGTSHHFNIYKVIDDKAFEPVSEAEGQLRDCSPASEQLAGDAAYIFGSATPERTFETPLGVAILLEPGQRLILEQHVLNFTPTPVNGAVSVDLYSAEDPATIDHYADIMWFNYMGIFLMPGQETSAGSTCTVPYDVNVIGIMSHMHELGTYFQVDRYADGAVQEMVYEDDDWAHPKYQVYDEPILLKQGDGLKWTCTWFNSKSDVVTFGQNSTNEMCITFALAYPTDSKVGDPISCDVMF